MNANIEQIRKTVDDIHRLMGLLVALQSNDRQCCRAAAFPEITPEPGQLPEPPPSQTPPALKDHYDEDELMTIKEAGAYIPGSRTKIYEWRMEGKLHTFERGCRNKRLIRAEVEVMRKWARDKGKW